jgi:ribosome modulation factor
MTDPAAVLWTYLGHGGRSLYMGYAKGRDARIRGKEESSNPYRPLSNHWYAWQRGWKEADAHEMVTHER